MIVRAIRIFTSLAIALSIVNFVGIEPAAAVNATCQESTDYSQTTNGDTVTIVFYNTSRICDFAVPSNLIRTEIAIVGGGGSGGGNQQPGGGGAGQVLYNASFNVTDTVVAVSVGAGGIGVTGNTMGNNGGNSSFGNFSAVGGGGGGSSNSFQSSQWNGRTGGSSGGSSRNGRSPQSVTQNSYVGWTSFGFAGGQGAGLAASDNGGAATNSGTTSVSSTGGGGGGGGAYASGGAATSTISGTSAIITGGAGGSAIFLIDRCLAGGGGGSANKSAYYTSGSVSAGAAASCFDRSGNQIFGMATGGGGLGASGVPNTGSGGGANTLASGVGNGGGGSGVIILRYSTQLPNQIITFSSIADKTFNTSIFRASATTDAPGETVTVTSLTTSVCTYSGETVTLVATGTCSLRASQPGSSRVRAATSVTRSFQVSKGTPTLGTFSNVSKTYGDTNFTVETVTASIPGSFAITSLNSSVVTISSRTASITGAGSATVRLLFTPSESTKWETASVTGIITVGKKVLTVTAPSNSVEYGSPRSAFSSSMNPTITGFAYGETQSVINVLPICVESETYTPTSSAVFSPYTITCSGGSDDNYVFSYVSGRLTVTKNDLSEYTDAQLATADRASIVYGDTVTITPLAVGETDNLFSGACTRVQNMNWTFRATSASGVCSVTIRQLSPNYESRTVVMTFPTTKRQLTVSGSTVASKSYDGTTTAGAVTVGTLSNLYGTDSIALSATASNYQSSAVGANKVTTLTYSIANGSGLASNYLAPASETYTATINKARPSFSPWSTITISRSSSGETLTAPTVTAPLSGGAFTYSIANASIATISGDVITPVSAGSTTITATYAPTDSSNYESGSISTTLTISKGARTIAFGSTSYSKTYGDSAFTVAATASAGGSDGTISYQSTGTGCSVGALTGLVTIIRAGSCSISATISTGTSYDQVSTTTPVTVTINRKSLSVTGTSIASRIYSGSSSPATITIGTVSGFATGESLTVTATASNYSSANAGTYNTNVRYSLSNGAGGIASNYLLADESVTATVGKKSLKITASNAGVNFGASAPTITPIYEGFVGSEDESVLDTAPTCTSSYTNTTPSGTSVASSCSGAADGNYSFTYASGSVTVNRNSRTIVLSISDTSLQYGETSTLTSSISAGSSEGTVSYLSSQPSLCSISGTTVTAIAASGTCQITASISAGVNNTSATSVYVAITLSKRELTVANAVVSNKVYDGSDSATVTLATLVGVQGSDIVTLSPIARFNNKNVGNSKSITSAMVIGGRDAGKYELTQPSLGTANISVKALTVSGLTVVNRNFDSSTVASISGTPVLVGAVAGDSISISGYTSGTFANMGPDNGIAVTTNISLSGSDASNYQLTQPALTGDISLILANTITFAAIPDKKFGVAPFRVAPTASSGLTVTVRAQGSACAMNGLDVTVTAVGICQLTAEQPGDANFSAADPVIETFTVLAAEITLTVANQAIVVGSPTPSNSYTLTGSLASGDALATPTYRYSSTSYASSTTAPTAAGVYVITLANVSLSSGNISNYRITIVNGTYSIGSASDKNLTGMVVFVPGSPSNDYLYGVFDPTKYTYSVLLPPSATTLRVTIARSEVSTFKSQVRINDSGYRTLKYSSTVGGTADSGDLPVPSGSNTILILITALDKSTLVYTINVYKDVVVRESETVTSSNVETIVDSRNAEIPTVASSVVTGITFLPVLTVTPTFSLTTYAYNATVPATQSSIIAIAGFQGQGFVIKTRINNGGFKAVGSNGRSQPMSLIKGSNQLFIRVEAGDGTVTVYAFTVTRL